MALLEQENHRWRGRFNPGFRARVSSSAGFRNSGPRVTARSVMLRKRDWHSRIYAWFCGIMCGMVSTTSLSPICATRSFARIPRRFSRYRYILVTLWVADDQALKARILDESRSSGYRDWQEALQLNRAIRARKLMKHEVRLNSNQHTVEELVEEVVKMVDLTAG